MHTYETIIELADGLQPELIRLRRDLHRHPEGGWEEMRTSALIARYLVDLGYEVLVGEQVCDRKARMGVPSADVLEAAYSRAVAWGADPEYIEHTRDGMTGVIGILRCGEGPVVAMRFDIDALGVHEAEDSSHFPAAEGFASVNPGVMHACGHDGHTACGLGVAQVLMKLKDRLHGTVKLIFQPAEEGVRGAKAIVEKGHLDHVDFFLGAHTTPMQDGIDLIPGMKGSLATNKYDVRITGKSAHAGGSPQLGNNALLAAAVAVQNLYAIPRHGQGATRINVGRLTAGSGRNVIADEAFMEIEVRGDSTELCAYMDEKALRVLDAAAAMYECTVSARLVGSADSIVCDMALVERIAAVCTEKLGMHTPEDLLSDGLGSEDVACMMNRVRSHGGQASFMRICSPQVGGAHNRGYDFDESYLAKSVKIFCATVFDLMK